MVLLLVCLFLFRHDGNSFDGSVTSFPRQPAILLSAALEACTYVVGRCRLLFHFSGCCSLFMTLRSPCQVEVDFRCQLNSVGPRMCSCQSKDTISNVRCGVGSHAISKSRIGGNNKIIGEAMACMPYQIPESVEDGDSSWCRTFIRALSYQLSCKSLVAEAGGNKLLDSQFSYVFGFVRRLGRACGLRQTIIDLIIRIFGYDVMEPCHISFSSVLVDSGIIIGVRVIVLLYQIFAMVPVMVVM